MRTRTRTLGVIGATVVTAGLSVVLAFGGNSIATSNTTATSTTTTSASMPTSQMPNMDSMMTADMSAMHSMMHQMMKGTVDDDVLAACDAAHAAMTDPTVTMPAQGGTQHEAHHPGTQS